jgi:hypothetical protein
MHKDKIINNNFNNNKILIKNNYLIINKIYNNIQIKIIFNKKVKMDNNFNNSNNNINNNIKINKIIYSKY